MESFIADVLQTLGSAAQTLGSAETARALLETVRAWGFRYGTELLAAFAGAVVVALYHFVREWHLARRVVTKGEIVISFTTIVDNVMVLYTLDVVDGPAIFRQYRLRRAILRAAARATDEDPVLHIDDSASPALKAVVDRCIVNFVSKLFAPTFLAVGR